MTSVKPVIGYLHERCLITDELKDRLKEIGDLRFVEPTVEGLAEIDILCSFAGFDLDRDLLAATPRLLATIDLGTAIHTDVSAATELGILVFHAPGANAQAVAEHTIGLTLALANGIVPSDRRMRSGQFRLADRRTWGVQLSERVLGLVGFGNVARRVANIASGGLGMKVKVWCRQPEEARLAGYEYVDLDELMSSADVVSVHLALNSDTKGLVDRRLLDLIQPTAFVVITARAEVVDFEGLSELLVAGKIAGAALDTWPNHSPDHSSALFELENVVLTEANAGLTDTAATQMADAVLDAVRSTLHSTAPSLATIANPVAWPPRPLGGVSTTPAH